MNAGAGSAGRPTAKRNGHAAGGRAAPHEGLFSAGALSEMCGDMDVTARQERAASEWLRLLKGNRLGEERRNYPKFTRIVLEDMLGYPAAEIDHEHDNIDFEFRGADGQTLVCFEAKGTSTADLFAGQRRSKREHSTPIRQTWDHMGKAGAKYGICTNYRHFVLIMREHGYRRHHLFDFEEARDDPGRLREFICVFSRERLEAGFAEKIRNMDDEAERELASEFYEIYGQTRLMLVKEFEESGAKRADAVGYAQTFLNRLIFVFFAQDAGLVGARDMFEKGVVDILRGNLTTNTVRVWKYITEELFAGFARGSDDPAIFGFNGGLFSEAIPASMSVRDRRGGAFFKEFGGRTRRGSWEFKRAVEEAVRRHDDTSPIVKNLLAMSSYNFKSQIRVNMLGQIFENSIGDIEELLGARTSRRKKEGVFYTPEYVTRYICRRTILPYLSKSGTASTAAELVAEYADDIEGLEGRLRSISILDPACGSGAFLIEAVNTLLDVHDEMQARRHAAGGIGPATLDPEMADALARRIIRKNVYGIDINRQSVEITKLSMFLLTASLHERLPDLADNIKAGNSLMSRTNGEFSAFAWEREFPAVFPNVGIARDESAGRGPDHGFDIVIGNPPYVKHQDIPYKEDIQLPRHSCMTLPTGFRIDGTTDLSAYFFYHAFRYLKEGGMLGYISSEAWMSSKYGVPLQQTLLDNASIREMTRAAFNFFGDADARAAIVILSRRGGGGTGADKGTVRLNYARTRDCVAGRSFAFSREVRQGGLRPGNWAARFKPALPRVPALGKTLGEAGRITYGRITGGKRFFVLTRKVVDEYGISERYLCPTVSRSTRAGRLGAGSATEWLLNVGASKRELRGRADGLGVLQYINDGEKIMVRPTRGKDTGARPLHKGTAMAGRRFWYSLELSDPPPIILRRILNDSLDVWENDGSFFTTNTLANFTPSSPGHARAFLAYFASSLYQHHLEAVGTEMGGGALSLEVFNFRESPVPDFDSMPASAVKKMSGAWIKYGRDPARHRRQIDKEVFEALGVQEKAAGLIVRNLGEMVRARKAGREGAGRGRGRAARKGDAGGGGGGAPAGGGAGR